MGLPLEIQQMIWRCSVPGRIHIPYADVLDDGPYTKHNHQAQHSTTCICKAACAVTCDKRRKVQIWKRVNLTREDKGENVFAWVDTQCDALYVDLGWDVQAGFDETENVFKTVIYPPQECSLYFEELNRLRFSMGECTANTVEQVQLVYASYDCKIARDAIPTENDFLMIDLDRDGEIISLFQLKDRHSEWRLARSSLMEDIEQLKQKHYSLLVCDGSLEGVEITNGVYQLRVGWHDNGVRVDIPKDATIEETTHSDYFRTRVWKIMMPWKSFADFLGILWTSDKEMSAKRPEFRRVAQLRLTKTPRPARPYNSKKAMARACRDGCVSVM